MFFFTILLERLQLVFGSKNNIVKYYKLELFVYVAAHMQRTYISVKALAYIWYTSVMTYDKKLCKADSNYNVFFILTESINYYIHAIK